MLFVPLIWNHTLLFVVKSHLIKAKRVEVLFNILINKSFGQLILNIGIVLFIVSLKSSVKRLLLNWIFDSIIDILGAYGTSVVLTSDILELYVEINVACKSI